MQKFLPKGEVGKSFITPAWAMTVSRPILMGMGVYHAYHGNIKKAFWYTAGAGISDFESPVAAATEKIWPGHGYSEYGKLGDQIADSAALAIGGIGIMANKRVHPISRIAMAYISFQEIRKAIQAQKITSEYQAVTQDKSLPDIPTTENGKNSMALKLAAVTAATATSSEKMGFFKRTALAIGSFATAHASVTYADAAQEEYRSYFYNSLLPKTQTKFSSEPTLSSTVASFISIPEI